MDRRKYARDYLVKKGLSSVVASGIVGNLQVESGFADDVIDFRRRGDNGSAYGLAQWRGERKDSLLKFAGDRSKTMEGQLDFLYHELTTNPAYKFDKISSAKTPSEAAKLFMDIYERPNKNPKINLIADRMKYANELEGVEVDYDINTDTPEPIKTPEQKTVKHMYGNIETLPQIDIKTEAEKAKEEIKYTQAIEDIAKQQIVQQSPQQIEQPEYNYLQDTNLFTLT